MKTNSYNLYEKGKHEDTIIYHSVADSEEQVRQLANESNIDISGLEIEIEKTNITDELGRPIKPYIENAIVE